MLTGMSSPAEVAATLPPQDYRNVFLHTLIPMTQVAWTLPHVCAHLHLTHTPRHSAHPLRLTAHVPLQTPFAFPQQLYPKQLYHQEELGTIPTPQYVAALTFMPSRCQTDIICSQLAAAPSVLPYKGRER